MNIKTFLWFFYGLLVLILVLWNTHTLADEQSILINQKINEHMFKEASANRFNLSDNVPLNYQQLLKLHGQDHLWFDNNQLNLSGISLLSLLNDLGISPFPFENTLPLANIPNVDQELSHQLFYIATLFNGYQLKPVENPREDIKQAIKNKKLASYVEKLLPQFDEVILLRSAISYFRTLSKKPWPQLDNDLRFKLGQGHKQITKLRYILSSLGDLDPSGYSQFRQHIFDPEIIIALKKFQTRHGLTAQGKLTPETIKSLNTPPEKRIKIMQINLWRWLSLPSVPPHRYVMVNIPSYRLSLVENQQETLSMKVIVGDRQHPTPIMVTQVNSVTVNPLWTPTYNIIHKELLLDNARNPGSLRRQNFKLAKGYGNSLVLKPVFKHTPAIKSALGQYRLVQASGKNNALGKYRFNIKNFHSVYLHDTPGKHLFKKANRALSHGCVRLQSSNRLAQHFLAHGTKERKKQVSNAIASIKTKHFSLEQAIPVYLTYQTVIVTEIGKLHWQRDIYQQDAKILLNSQSSARVSNVMLVQR